MDDQPQAQVDSSSQTSAVYSTTAAEISVNESPVVSLSTSDSYLSAVSSASGIEVLSVIENFPRHTYRGNDTSECKNRISKRSRGTQHVWKSCNVPKSIG